MGGVEGYVCEGEEGGVGDCGVSEGCWVSGLVPCSKVKKGLSGYGRYIQRIWDGFVQKLDIRGISCFYHSSLYPNPSYPRPLKHSLNAHKTSYPNPEKDTSQLHRPNSKLGTITGPYLLTPIPPSACTIKSHAKLSLPPAAPAISVLPNVPLTTSGSYATTAT